MKKNIFTFLTATVAAIAIFLSITGLKTADVKNIFESIITKDTFTNCIFNAEYSEVTAQWQKPELHVARNLNRYNLLNFNAVHQYDAMGSSVYGKPDAVLTTDQINNYKDFLDSVKTYGNLYGFFERSFLSRYSYGQRLIYEVSGSDNDTGLNFGFVYKDCMENTYCTDLGRTVLHADPQVHSSGYLCRDIYENLQHSDLFDFRQNDKGMWYIKPVIRIPTGMDDDIPVVRIEVMAFNGTKVKEIDIFTQNFKTNGYYNGDYKESYLGLLYPLQISGGTNPTDLNYGRTADSLWCFWDTACKVDFRVFWYGECNVWFDKMIVDDEIGNELFNSGNQSTYINPRIDLEMSSFKDYGSMHSFFVDEVLISQYPCLKYVADRMRLNRPAPKLSIAVTNYLHIHGLRNDNLSYGVYLDSIQPDFLQCDHHGFSESIPKIPDAAIRNSFAED